MHTKHTKDIVCSLRCISSYVCLTEQLSPPDYPSSLPPPIPTTRQLNMKICLKKVVRNYE